MTNQLLSVSHCLSNLNVRHCLVGGFAVAIHGIPRFTDDLDFLVGPEIKSVQKEIQHFAAENDGHYRYIQSELDDPVGDVLQLTVAGMQVDLLCAKSPHELRALEHIEYEEFQGERIAVIAPEDLILLKLYAGGPQDLYDIAGIIQVCAHKLDEAYLNQQINNPYLRQKWEIAQKLAHS